jgi:wobble nucleotide-excising tRNase
VGSYRTYKHWTMAEQKRLERLWPSATWEELNKEFPKRTLWSLQCKAQQLGVKRPIGRPRQRLWTTAEEGQVNALSKKIKRAERTVDRHQRRLSELRKEKKKLLHRFTMRMIRKSKIRVGSLLIPYQGKERKEDRNTVST